MFYPALAQVIGAIGEEGFAAAAAASLREAMGFDLAAAVLHRNGDRADLLFDDFAAAGHGRGIDNYVRFTHRMSPMLHPAPRLGAIRAADFRVHAGNRSDRRLIWTAEEEMGFRTAGWPERCEEIGLYFAAWDGIVELSFYRERGRAAFPAGGLRALGALSGGVAAAFDRHAVLARPLSAGAGLSVREREVHELMVAGCSSEAIALRLGISRHTVKDHRKRIFRKLQVGSLAELFARSRRPH